VDLAAAQSEAAEREQDAAPDQFKKQKMRCERIAP
jgi:hypothetical protein